MTLRIVAGPIRVGLLPGPGAYGAGGLMTEIKGAIRGGANRSAQVRAPRAHEWTTKKRALFLDVLAATANVEASAAAAGMHPTSAHALRRRDPEFARLCREALAAAADRLEAELLARALGKSDGENPTGEREEPGALPPFNEALALKLLQMQRASEGRAGGRRTGVGAPLALSDAADESLRRKLDRILRRVEQA